MMYEKEGYILAREIYTNIGQDENHEISIEDMIRVISFWGFNEESAKDNTIVQPEPKKREWIFVDKAHEHAHCSECDYGNVDLLDGRPHNYCTNCGCYMVEPQESEEYTMIFEVGKTYQHTTGKRMTIIGRLKTHTYGECLIGEHDTGELVPVGECADGWHESEDKIRQDTGEQMEFPETFEQFAKQYGFKDDKEVYTSGSDLIPVFRVKQWLNTITEWQNKMVEMVELVIKIPEEVYEKIQKRKVNQYDIDDICQSVFEGTLLPKGHGRIVDISKMMYMKTLNEAIHNRLSWVEAIRRIKNSAPTIVEAESEEV